MKGNNEEALAIMISLEDDYPEKEAVAAREFEEIKQSIETEQVATKSVVHLQRQTMPKFRMILGVGAQAMQQLTGINIGM